jgi:peptidoglycan/xylan/chitin deacetylase (PgdA/CDA1 family)
MVRIFLGILLGIAISGFAADRYSIIHQRYTHRPAGVFGMNIPGVVTHIATDEPVIALTFDACGGHRGSDFDNALVEFLTDEAIPATFFLNARWIQANRDNAALLQANPLFELENHGSQHHPLTFEPRQIYGIEGTGSVKAAYEEVEKGAEAVASVTGFSPLYFRSGTAWYDESAVQMVRDLGYQAVNGDVVPVDGDSTRSAGTIAKVILSEVKPGSIVMLHCNHPDRHTLAALRIAIPELRERGWRFVRLDAYRDRLE